MPRRAAGNVMAFHSASSHNRGTVCACPGILLGRVSAARPSGDERACVIIMATVSARVGAEFTARPKTEGFDLLGGLSEV